MPLFGAHNSTHYFKDRSKDTFFNILILLLIILFAFRQKYVPTQWLWILSFVSISSALRDSFCISFICRKYLFSVSAFKIPNFEPTTAQGNNCIVYYITDFLSATPNMPRINQSGTSERSFLLSKPKCRVRRWYCYRRRLRSVHTFTTSYGRALPSHNACSDVSNSLNDTRCHLRRISGASSLDADTWFWLCLTDRSRF